MENIWFFSRQIFYLMEKYECILKILYCYRYFIFCRLFTYVFIILHIIFVSTLFLQLYNKILISTKNEDTWFFRSSLQLFIAKFPFFHEIRSWRVSSRVNWCKNREHKGQTQFDIERYRFICSLVEANAIIFDPVVEITVLGENRSANAFFPGIVSSIGNTSQRFTSMQLGNLAIKPRCFEIIRSRG